MARLEEIHCEHEGLDLVGRLAVPQGSGPHPGVLVVHNAFGLGEQTCEIARRLASAGYAALAVDMYGGGAYSEDSAVVGTFVAPLWGNSARLRARMDVWLAVLRQRSEVVAERIAAIGYCFGGQCVLELARGGADVRAVASFHGILSTDAPAAPGAVRAHVAVYTGARDPHAPRGDVEALRAEMEAAGADWQITEYGRAYHAFTDPGANTPQTGRQYDALADRTSWASTLALLDDRLRGL